MLKKSFLTIVTTLLLLSPAALATAGEIGLQVTPEQIDIGLNFKGSTLEIAGNVPPGSDVCLKVESPPGTVALNRKGKVGPFWMTVDHVQAENVPKIYEVLSTRPLEEIPQKAREQMEVGPGYSYLKEHARVLRKQEESKEVLSPAEAGDYLNGLFEIYEKKAFYLVDAGALQNENGRFHASVSIPAAIPPGKTKITAYAISGDRVVATGEFPLQVNSVGLVNWVRSEATANGPFYGLIAVVVALLVGLVTGTLFNSLGRSRKGLEADSGAH
ncbi:hypothetical protein PTH_2262 [Pelotomaculum thermopropionicum SI]|uniref:Transmembrane protein n=1 Tax=Pelotomaculum thermopropionicum (strain DSM 13744 / JCM 10971 / SI) TaxID=370438 RepID=A5CZY0_PELTS|nr:hypothetical protein PTH_2262 [Pelotomaculum thermopropionicum SI]